MIRSSTSCISSEKMCDHKYSQSRLVRSVYKRTSCTRRHQRPQSHGVWRIFMAQSPLYSERSNRDGVTSTCSTCWPRSQRIAHFRTLNWRSAKYGISLLPYARPAQCTQIYTHSPSQEGGDRGKMRNVVRLFNDEVGVELCERTGRSPAFQYLQIGCSRKAEQQMLSFAKAQVGKPFNMLAMVRSVAWPRKTNQRNYYCAELVASVLKSGGLMCA